MNIQRVILTVTAIVAALSMSGCIQWANATIDEKYILDKKSGQGVVIFSTSLTGKHFPTQRILHFQPTGTVENCDKLYTWRFGYSTEWDDIDSCTTIVRNDSTGFLTFYITTFAGTDYFGRSGTTYMGKKGDDILRAAALPAGPYKFHMADAEIVAPGIYSVDEFPGAVPGATYDTMSTFQHKWCSLKFNVIPGEAKYIGHINWDIPGGLTVTDRSEQDLVLFKNKYPNIPVTDIKIEILKTE